MAYHNPFKSKEDADKVLFEFDDVARKMGIQYFLIAGTCLGFIRDKDYIKGDNDIDVGIKCGKERRKQFFRELEKSGFIRNGVPCARRGINIHFLRNKTLVDVFIAGKNVENPYANSFRKIAYNGREFNIFKNAEGYLAHKYGNWKTPKRAKGYSK